MRIPIISAPPHPVKWTQEPKIWFLLCVKGVGETSKNFNDNGNRKWKEEEFGLPDGIK